MPVMICKADVSQADFDTLNWPLPGKRLNTSGSDLEPHMEYRSGDDDNKPLFTWGAERKTAPLKRINVWFSSSKKDTAGNISSEFILINTLNDISVLWFSFKQCTNESHWFNFDKNEVLNEQSRYLLMHTQMVSPSPGGRVSAFRGLAKGTDCQKLFRLQWHFRLQELWKLGRVRGNKEGFKWAPKCPDLGVL